MHHQDKTIFSFWSNITVFGTEKVKSVVTLLILSPHRRFGCMVKSGCLSSSRAGGRSSLVTSRHRSSRSLSAGEIFSGIGGGSDADAICNT